MMVLVAGDHAEFYWSPNLIDWSLTGTFGAPYGARGGVWECPDLFPLEIDGKTKWVLIISVGDGVHAGGSGTQYFVGQFDGKTFTSDNLPEVVLWLDFGADNYAGVTYNDTPDERRLFVGWMNNWSYARDIPAETWRGSMTVPRELRLVHVPGHGIRLAQQPVRELQARRTRLCAFRDENLESTSRRFAQYDDAALDIEVEFAAESAWQFGVTVSHNAEQRTILTVDPQRQTLTLDRRHSGATTFHEAFTWQHIAPVSMVADRVRLRVLLDANSVEVFAVDGVTVLTSQIFPDGSAISLELFADSGTVRVVSLDVYSLKRS